MMSIKHSRLYIIWCVCLAWQASAALAQTAGPRLAGEGIAVENLKVDKTDRHLVVSLDLNLDSLDMPANRQFVFTPLVEAKENNRTMPQIIVNGRKADITFRRGGSKRFAADVTAVRRKNNTEQTVSYSAVVPYEEWMRNCNVLIAQDLCGCGDTLDRDVVELRRLRSPFMPYVRPKAEGIKARVDSGKAFIDFPVDKITLYPDYRNNPSELDKIIRSINVVKNDRNTSITRVEIHGYASPESPYEHNAWLADNRAKTLTEYVRRLVNLPDTVFRVCSTPEDWAGLRDYVAKCSLPNRDKILETIDNTGLDPDAREWKIKLTWPDDYRVLLHECYPALRHSDYKVDYVVRPFTVDEAREILKTNPKLLSLEEMFLVAQTYEPGSDDFNNVMETAVRMFPADTTANLNAACARVELGDFDGAETYLAKVGDTPQAMHLRGVMAMMRGDHAEALRLLDAVIDGGDSTAQRNKDILLM